MRLLSIFIHKYIQSVHLIQPKLPANVCVIKCCQNSDSESDLCCHLAFSWTLQWKLNCTNSSMTVGKHFKLKNTQRNRNIESLIISSVQTNKKFKSCTV